MLHEHFEVLHAFDRDRIVKCISSLMYLLKTDLYRTNDVVIVSMIGRLVSLYGFFPHEFDCLRQKHILLNQDVDRAKEDLLYQLFNCLFSYPLLAEEAKAALQNLRSINAIKSLKLEVDGGRSREVIGCFQNTNSIVLTLSSKHLMDSECSGGSIFHSSRWMNCKSINYSEWIRNLASGIVIECYRHFLDEVSDDMSPHSKRPSIVGGEPLFSPLLGVCFINKDVAEMVLILTVYDILEYNGSDSEAHSKLSSLVNDCLLHSDSTIEASRLGCRLLIFLFRQDVSSKKKVRSTRGRDLKKKLVFDCLLNVDVYKAFLAAKRCGYPCSALLFYVLWLQINDPIVNEAALLFEIFCDLNDADALSGLKNSVNSEQEALLYMKNGNWIEAFMTFDCMLQDSRLVTGNKRLQAEFGLVKSLQSLRSDHLVQNLRFLGEVAVTELSHWSFQDPEFREVDLEHSPISFGVQFNAIINYLSRGAHVLARKSIESCTSVIVPKLLEGVANESPMSIISTFEICKMVNDLWLACKALESKTSNQIAGLLLGWKPENLSSAVVSNRCLLCASLLNNKVIEETNAVAFLEKLSFAAVSKSDAFVLSPILQRFRNILFQENPLQRRIDADSPLYEWYIIEANIQWKKLLVSAAIDLIESQVIKPLASIADSEGNHHARDVLSEGYRLLGIWASSSRRLSERDIIRNYLEPAVAIAQNKEQLIKAHLALGNFYAKLHQSILNRKLSQEWRDWERISAERLSAFYLIEFTY